METGELQSERQTFLSCQFLNSLKAVARVTSKMRRISLGSFVILVLKQVINVKTLVFKRKLLELIKQIQKDVLFTCSRCFCIVYYYSQVMQARIEVANIVEKAAHFENQLTPEIKESRLKLCYLGSTNLVNLTLSLKISNLQRQMLTNAQLFYMDPCTRVCQYLGVYPFQEDIFVEIDLKSKEKVHFKFRKVGAPTVPNNEANQNKNARKCRERTIGQVRNHLENRNRIYRNVSGSTLQQAADMVGLPKKTLDDYDRHIRIAQAYGFDFDKHKNSGMGVLRSFVKEQSSKEKPDSPVKQEFIEPGYFLSIGPNGQP